MINVLEGMYTKCGIENRNVKEDSNRIVGGWQAWPHEFPWQAYIHLRLNNGKETFCGGSVITNKHILTAAHCTEGVKL